MNKSEGLLARLATVIWWFGALSIAIGSISFVASLLNDRPDGLFVFVSGVVVGLFFWCGAFVLGGSFLTPAMGPLSRS